MKYYMFKPKDKKTEFRTKKLNKRRVIELTIAIIIVAIAAGVALEYNINEQFREFIDVKILRKEISNQNTIQIDISGKNNPSIYTYYKYLTILDKNSMEVYSSTSKPDFKLEILITNPIYSDNNRFLCVAENSGNKAYLVSGENIIWQKDVEGEISKINVNRNGYVAIVTSNTGYKTIITLYNPNGEELFKTYLPTTYAGDIEISDDNKYLAIAEINTSGAAIESNVKTVSIENAKTSPEDAFVKANKEDNKGLITNLKYQDKDKLVCMYSDVIVNAASSTILKTIDSNTLFADINLDNSIATVTKQVGGILKTDYYMNLLNVSTLKENQYRLSNLPKSIYCHSNVIAINYGTEVEIINTSGWLIRRYKSSLQEIKDIRLTESLVSIIYKDKVEIINF